MRDPRKTIPEFELPVSHWMTAPVHTIQDKERLTVAARELERLQVSALPVLDGFRLTGVLAHSDLLRVGRRRHRGTATGPNPCVPELIWPGFSLLDLSLPDLSVAECMQQRVPVISPELPLSDCARRMLDGARRLYVMVDRALQGVISPREMLQALSRARLEIPLGEMPAAAASPLAVTASLSLVSDCLRTDPRQSLVVVDAAPVGVFSSAELQAALEADQREAAGLWMDRSILILPADVPVSIAAEQTLRAGARYLITGDERAGYRVFSGLAFAGWVRAFSASLPHS